MPRRYGAPTTGGTYLRPIVGIYLLGTYLRSIVGTYLLGASEGAQPPLCLELGAFWALD